MEAADGTASNRNESEGKNLPGKNGASAVYEAGERRHVQGGMQGHNANSEKRNRAELHEGAEVVAGGQQKPHRHGRSRKSVDDDENRERGRAQSKDAGHGRILRSPLPTPNREQHKHEANGGDFQHFAGTNPAEVQAHEQRDRNCHRDRKSAPGAVFQGVDHDQRRDSEQNHKNRNHGRVSHEAADASDFFLRHLSEGLAIAPHRKEKNHEILHASSEDGTRQHPQRSWKIAELRGQHRTDQWARPGDGGEMMPKHHPFIRHQKVAAVFQALGGSSAKSVERQNLSRDELAIEAVTKSIAAGRGHNQPEGVNRFSAVNGNGGNCHGAQEAHNSPAKKRQNFIHVR